MSDQEPTIMEMAQHIVLSRSITSMLGGLFPEKTPVSSLKTILEIGCDVGTWSLDVAKAHPEMEVIGLDTRRLSLAYAEGQRIALSLSNVEFRCVECLTHWDLAEHSV